MIDFDILLLIRELMLSKQSLDQVMISFNCVSCRAYKTIVEDDLKFPLIYGEGKKVRREKKSVNFI